MHRNPHFYQYVLTKCQDTFFPFLVGIFCFPLCPISVSECGKPHIDSEHTSLDKQKRRQGGVEHHECEEEEEEENAQILR